MLQQIKMLSLLSCVAFTLQACHEDDGMSDIASAPKQLANVNATVYGIIRQNPDANTLFANTGATNIGDEPCDVKIHRMAYDTVGSAGEAATSSGVFMLPHGDDPRCSGALPVVLHAHGTADEKNYDLSQFIGDPTNAAANEAGLLLATYAAQGYAVIAPNFAGYADSSLSYHPYIDRKQQSAEMMHALDHVREYADILGANLSSELIISGVSGGAYASMATHQALEASGEKVTASVNISGPYAMLDYLDTIAAGYVNLFAPALIPLYWTALDKGADIYDDPGELYAEAYAGIAETALPAIGGFASTALPQSAIWSGAPPADANPVNALGFGDDHLLSDALRANYLADMQANPTDPVYKVRAEIKKADLRDWQPQAPVLMCGAGTDPVVFHRNSDLMAEYWGDLVTAGLVTNLDLTDTPVGPFAGAMQAFQSANPAIPALHGAVSPFCALAGLGYISLIRSQQDSEQLELKVSAN
ncbi:MAG: Unknown protein [uncultured Thiotrichaceae bacterium]|uniref:Lysophospholipase (EC) n=1 Tax=uncultured Thiotrichaceae bacterium TaxID=298394 RepID=A0A6S6SMQ1_9GAMM|nr:MAG: Unknown protein [uncultured Thiotrichaceae bacterium]